jgi:hypothetical protein
MEPQPGFPVSPTVGQTQEENTSVMDLEFLVNRYGAYGPFFNPRGQEPQGGRQRRQDAGARATAKSARCWTRPAADTLKGKRD